ncbi:MAG: GSCFA domain-containing protein [Betaproteobacteria bacterium]|nr:GSCFA domain-containing protein [Betaproteobacteria bacterium]
MFFNQIAISKKPNKKWSVLFKKKMFTLRQLGLEENPKFFCIGSCFAEYVRTSLESQTGTHCFPDYRNLQVDTTQEIADTIQIGKFHMNHYSVGSILQEFTRALGISEELNFPPIEIEGLNIIDGLKVQEKNSVIFQDPYRREVYAKTLSKLVSLSQRINELVKSGIYASNVFIITLGLVEIWEDSSTGNIFNQFPGYLGVGYNSKNLRFRRASYAELVAQLSELMRIIFEINEENAVIISVSPIPLQLTFTNDDVFQANTYSKSLLRSVVEEIRQLNPRIHYFPSYEMAMNLGSEFFQDRDLRHAKTECVDQIMKVFLRSISRQESEPTG